MPIITTLPLQVPLATTLSSSSTDSPGWNGVAIVVISVVVAVFALLALLLALLNGSAAVSVATLNQLHRFSDCVNAFLGRPLKQRGRDALRRICMSEIRIEIFSALLKQIEMVLTRVCDVVPDLRAEVGRLLIEMKACVSGYNAIVSAHSPRQILCSSNS